MKKSLLALALLSVTGLANANLIVNGSFEAPTQTPGTYGTYFGTSVPGWVAGTNGIEVRNNLFGTAEDGVNFVELDTFANSNMSQTVTTTAGVLYSLDYWYSPRVGQPASTNGVSSYWNGVLLTNSTGNGGSINNWVDLSFLVTGTGNDILSFYATGTSDSLGGNVDNVSLTATPLPAAVWLMASGLGFLGFGRRKSI